MRNSEEMRRLFQYRRFVDDKVMRSSRLHNLRCVEDALGADDAVPVNGAAQLAVGVGPRG